MDNIDFIEKFVSRNKFSGTHGNLSANGNRLYSYETCIAEKGKDINGDNVIIVSDNTFSNTTAKHISILRSKCAGAGVRTVRLPQYYDSAEFYPVHVIKDIKDTLTWCAEDGVSRKNVRETIIKNYNMLESTLTLAKFVVDSSHINELLDQYRDLYNNAKDKERARIEKLRAKYN